MDQVCYWLAHCPGQVAPGGSVGEYRTQSSPGSPWELSGSKPDTFNLPAGASFPHRSPFLLKALTSRQCWSPESPLTASSPRTFHFFLVVSSAHLGNIPTPSAGLSASSPLRMTEIQTSSSPHLQPVPTAPTPSMPCSLWPRGIWTCGSHLSCLLLAKVNHSNPLQYSCLENSKDRGAWWAAVCGVIKNWTWLSMHACDNQPPDSTLTLPISISPSLVPKRLYCAVWRQGHSSI